MDKESNLLKNIQCIIFSILAIAITAICAIFKRTSIEMTITIFLCGLVGTLSVRFYYEICLIHNGLHNAYHTKNGSSEGNEPSDFILFITKSIGYILIMLQIAFLFFN